MAFLDIDQPKTPGQWILWGATMGIVCTSPLGAIAVVGSLREEILKTKILKEKEINSRNLSSALYYAKKRKLIKLKKDGDKVSMVLTEKGKKRRLKYSLENIKIDKPKKWDGQWRLLMFDIPHKYKSFRDDLRHRLIRLGFIEFQKSVWIYPYPCQNEIDFISEVLGMGKYLHLLTAKIENDKKLRSKFSIS